MDLVFFPREKDPRNYLTLDEDERAMLKAISVDCLKGTFVFVFTLPKDMSLLDYSLFRDGLIDKFAEAHMTASDELNTHGDILALRITATVEDEEVEKD